MTIRIPWRAWYGDEWLDIRTPSSWQVRDYWPTGGPDIASEGIEQANTTSRQDTLFYRCPGG